MLLNICIIYVVSQLSRPASTNRQANQKQFQVLPLSDDVEDEVDVVAYCGGERRGDARVTELHLHTDIHTNSTHKVRNFS